MAGVPSLEQGECCAVAHLADDDPVRTQAHGRLEEPLHVDEVAGPESHDVRARALELARIFEDDDAMVRRNLAHVVQDRVRQGGLARSGASHDEDVLPVTDRSLYRGALT